VSFKVVVFDWDGTLVDSEQHIVSSITYATEQVGLPERDYSAKKNIIGLSMKEALLSLYPHLDEAEIVEVRKHFSEWFFSKPTGQDQLFDGVIDVLETLREKDVRLAVATGKSRHGLEKALDTTTLRRYFDITRCADETRSKPDPLMLRQIVDYYALSVNDILMVGDTEFDLSMAHQIDMPRVAVSHGVHDVDRLLRYQPLKVVDHLSELLEFYS